jgi:hypothetical protein
MKFHFFFLDKQEAAPILDQISSGLGPEFEKYAEHAHFVRRKLKAGIVG